MKPHLVALLLLALGCFQPLRAQPPTSAAASAPPTPLPSTSPATSAAPTTSAWQPDNRLTLAADGVTLSGTDGGAGGDISYLQQLNPDTTLGAGVDYQELDSAFWKFGSLNAAFSHALTANSRWDVHAEAHEGDGTSTGHSFTYSIIAGGLGLAVPGGVALDVADSYLNVDHSEGYLPKLSLAKAWGTHWLTTIAYSQSSGGNLDTNYSLARVDFVGRGFGLLGGVSVGRVSPAVVNIDGLLQIEARHVTETFLGVSKSIARVDLSLLGDNVELVGIRHFTLTLACTIHFR